MSQSPHSRTQPNSLLGSGTSPLNLSRKIGNRAFTSMVQVPRTQPEPAHAEPPVVAPVFESPVKPVARARSRWMLLLAVALGALALYLAARFAWR